VNKIKQLIKNATLQISNNKFKVTIVILLILNLFALMNISSMLEDIDSEVSSIEFEVSSIQSDINSIESDVGSIYYSLD